MCFVWIWEQTAIISLYSINWLVFITETECVYCAVRTGSLYTASLTFTNSTFCPHSVLMCFVWIWEQIAIISLYNINWLAFITETECVYCAVRSGSSYIIHVTVMLKGIMKLYATFPLCTARHCSPTALNSWPFFRLFKSAVAAVALSVMCCYIRVQTVLYRCRNWTLLVEWPVSVR